MFARGKDERAVGQGMRKNFACRFLDRDRRARRAFPSFTNAILMLGMLAQCGRVVDAPGSIDHITTPTSVPVLAPTDMETERVDGSITLFKNVVAGDYQLLHIASNGLMEAVRWSRPHQILEYQQEELPTETVDELFRLALALDSSVEENMYDVYPLPEGSTLIYEDIYYLLRIDTTDAIRTIIAHEAVMPQPLSDFVAEAFAIRESIDFQEIAGQFLLAGDRELIGFKRYVRGENWITLTPQDLSSYPTLVRLIESQYVLYPVPDFWDTKLSEHFYEDRISLTVELPDLMIDVLLLTAGTE
ncbi:MAG: hypothetical protein PVJ07_02195 [Anaerolineales bacterium]|jgi:hypothetical protein